MPYLTQKMSSYKNVLTALLFAALLLLTSCATDDSAIYLRHDRRFFTVGNAKADVLTTRGSNTCLIAKRRSGNVMSAVTIEETEPSFDQLLHDLTTKDNITRDQHAVLFVNGDTEKVPLDGEPHTVITVDAKYDDLHYPAQDYEIDQNSIVRKSDCEVVAFFGNNDVYVEEESFTDQRDGDSPAGPGRLPHTRGH